LGFLASFCKNLFVTPDEIITPAALFACTEKRFLTFAAATLGGHLAQSSEKRRKMRMASALDLVFELAFECKLARLLIGAHSSLLCRRLPLCCSETRESTVRELL
jgi:hypothetical protein